MEQISFDSGLKSYCINGKGILSFHPGDPNLYLRFEEAAEKIENLQKKLSQFPETDQTANDLDFWKLLEKTDQEMKEILNWIFGAHNDFQELLGGVNLLAVADNGKQVIYNLLEALEPILLDGAKACADQQIQKAALQAEERRDTL